MMSLSLLAGRIVVDTYTTITKFRTTISFCAKYTLVYLIVKYLNHCCPTVREIFKELGSWIIPTYRWTKHGAAITYSA